MIFQRSHDTNRRIEKPKNSLTERNGRSKYKIPLLPNQDADLSKGQAKNAVGANARIHPTAKQHRRGRSTKLRTKVNRRTKENAIKD